MEPVGAVQEIFAIVPERVAAAPVGDPGAGMGTAVTGVEAAPEIEFTARNFTM